jgi:DNA-binding transcriptional LysR family regulator
MSAAPGDLDVQTLRIVRAIQASGSLTAASKALGISQPAISQHLQRAEARLGVPLVSRHGRTVRLSDAGRVVAELAPDVIDSIDRARERIAELAAHRAGRVDLAGFPSASATLLPPLLSVLRRTSPGIALSYTEGEPTESTQLVIEGRIDLAIVARYPGEPDMDRPPARELTLLPLYLDEMLLILPADHPLAGETAVDVADLQDDEWIAGCPLCRGHVVAACRGAGYEPRITFETDNFSAVLGLVSRSLGVAILPRLALGSSAVPRGVVVRRTVEPASRVISLLAGTDTLEVPAVAATVAALSGLDVSAWRLKPRRAA